MSEGVGLGEALAAGNAARVYRDKPITNALNKAVQINLAQESKKAQAEMARQKRIEMLTKSMDIPAGKYLPFYESQVRERLPQKMNEMYERAQSEDPFGANKAEVDAKVFVNGIQAQNNEVVANSGAPGNLRHPLLSKILMQDHKSGSKALREYNKNNPAFTRLADADENGNLVVNQIKDVDEEKRFWEDTSHLKAVAAQDPATAKMITNKQGTVFAVPTEDQIDAVAKSYGSDVNNINNFAIKHPADFTKYVDLAEKELDGSGVPKDQRSQELVESAATFMYAKDQLTNRISRGFEENIYKAQPSNKKDDGSGPYTIDKKEFNPSFAEPDKHIDAYVKAGVIAPRDVENYNRLKATDPAAAKLMLPDILAIDPPNTGTFTIKDEKGNNFKADNLKLIYVPKTASGKGGQWFMSGSTTVKGREKSVNVPVNEKTYGNIFSVYGKMSTADVTTLLNQRMKDGGITNDVFKIDLSPRLITPIKKEVLFTARQLAASAAFEKQFGRKPTKTEQDKINKKWK